MLYNKMVSIYYIPLKIFCFQFVCVFPIPNLLAVIFRLDITFANSFKPDQDRHSVGPDLGPNCLTF